MHVKHPLYLTELCPRKMVGAESAALSASRMSSERSAGELRPRKVEKLERVNGIAPSSRPWHGRILLLNHTRDLNAELRMQNAELSENYSALCTLHSDFNWYARPVTLRIPALI